MSIRRFLLIGLLSTLVLSFAIIFLFIRNQTLVEVGELYDTQLAQTSRILQGFLNRPADEIDFDHLNAALLTVTQHYTNDDNEEAMRSAYGHQYEHKFAIQIWDKETNLLVKSPAAPMYAMADFQEGYSIKNMGNYDWNVFTQHIDTNGYWVIVAERGDIREEIIEKLTLSSFLGPFTGMLFLALGVILVVMRGLKPLTDLSAQISERNIDKLEPLELKSAPKELKPLGNAVNFLMERVSQDVERERRFLGDIAHELRTPLAAMKLNAQNGLHSKELLTSESSNLQNILIKIVRGVDRSIRLIEQLLTLARLDPRALGEQEIFTLGEMTQDVVSTLSHQHFQNTIGNVRISESLMAVQLKAYPDLISVMLRNLIENACRYTQGQGDIQLTGEIHPDGAFELIVCDQGPGVSELQLQSLGKRFFRERPADRMGSGLGLSIVARIAELHSSRLAFSNLQPRGLKVSVLFPAEVVVLNQGAVLPGSTQ